MNKIWSFFLAVLFVNLILTNGENQIQQVIAELRNETSQNHQEEDDEFKKIFEDVEAVMDPTVDPCENFYQFVCGRYSNESLSPYNRALKETEKHIISKYEQEKLPNYAEESNVINLSKYLYKSCIKPKTAKDFDEFLLRDIEAIGGWPALKGDSWNSSAFDWKRTVFKAGNQIMWMNYLFRVDLQQTNASISLKLEPIIYNNEKAHKLAVQFGGNNSVVAEELERVNEFSKNFTKIYSSYLDAERDPIKTTLQNLIDKYPYYPWLEHFRYILPIVQLNGTIILPNSAVIENLHSLLNNTDQRMLANIVAWNRISDIYNTFPTYFRLLKNPDSRYCYDLVSQIFPEAIATMYLRRFGYDNKMNETKQLAGIILNKIKEQFIEMLGNADWISNKTYLIEKLEKLDYQFGLSLESLENTNLIDHHRNFRSNTTGYYETILTSTLLNRKMLYSEKPVPYRQELSDYFDDTERAPNAYYRASSNKIIVRLSLLHRMFIDANNPMWMNFASFGSIIGREFGLSLDRNLIQTDANGELIPWSKNSSSYIEYHKKIRCLNDMYRDIANISRDVQSNEDELPRTPEDVADTLGFNAAYSAYKNSSVKGNRKTLHQREYSPDQLFWIYATNRLCKIKQPLTEAFKYHLRHPIYIETPDELRILASLSNNDGFSRDFNCPANSLMNRQPKCSIF